MLWMVRDRVSRLRGPAGFFAGVFAGSFAGVINGWRTVCHATGHWACRPRLLCLHVRDMLALQRSRRQLANLAPHQRADIGVTTAEAEQECRAPVLGEVSLWAALELRAAVNAARRPTTPPPRHQRSFYRARGRGDLPG